MPHKTPDSCLVMEWLPEGLKRSLKRKKPPTPVGGGSLLVNNSQEGETMVDNSWLMAFRVFAWGFSGVFLGLLILMFFTIAMSAVVRGIEKKEKKSELKGG